MACFVICRPGPHDNVCCTPQTSASWSQVNTIAKCHMRTYLTKPIVGAHCSTAVVTHQALSDLRGIPPCARLCVTSQQPAAAGEAAVPHSQSVPGSAPQPPEPAVPGRQPAVGASGQRRRRRRRHRRDHLHLGEPGRRDRAPAGERLPAPALAEALSVGLHSSRLKVNWE